ncbi:MAG: type II CAAX endopeptidase family protein [Kofleriaceae bacterium]
MTSPSPSERTPSFYHARRVSAPGTIALTFAGVLVIYLVQIAAAPLIGMLPAAALSYIVISLVVWKTSRDLKFSLGVTGARARFWIAAVLIGLSVWLLDLAIVDLLKPRSTSTTLATTVANEQLWATLPVLALCPAIGEELLFRGVLVRGLANRPGWRWIAVGVSAIVFSTYHLDPPQIVGTLLIGIALATLATGARSIVPGMVAHALNNTVVLLLARGKLAPVVTAMSDYPDITLVTCTGMFLAGIALCVREVKS